MNGVFTIGSGVLAVVRTSDGRNLRRPPGLLAHMVTIPFKGLQIVTHIHTRRIEE